MTEGAAVDPAMARKRRKEIMQSLRSGEGADADSTSSKQASETAAIPSGVAATAAAVAAAAAVAESEATLPPPKKRKVGKNKKDGSSKSKKAAAKAAAKSAEEEDDDDDAQKKTQVRYDPEVPMEKEQLAAWRREARRVRNRESAAASRQRIRDRINELEGEVGQWKNKYTQAMERLQQLEQLAASQNNSGSEAV